MPMHILLVEDEHHVRHALGKALTRHGHEVSEAGSAGDATALLGTREFDVLVVDINLPDATGWDVLRARSPGPNATTPAVVMSALQPSVLRVREFAPVGVLLKPFPVDALFHAAGLAAARREEK